MTFQVALYQTWKFCVLNLVCVYIRERGGKLLQCANIIASFQLCPCRGYLHYKHTVRTVELICDYYAKWSSHWQLPSCCADCFISMAVSCEHFCKHITSPTNPNCTQAQCQAMIVDLTADWIIALQLWTASPGNVFFIIIFFKQISSQQWQVHSLALTSVAHISERLDANAVFE